MEECMPHIFFFLLPMWDMGKWVGRTGEEFCGYSGWEKIMHFFRTFCGKSFFPSSSCRRRCCCCIRFECCSVTPFPFPRIDSINTKRGAKKNSIEGRRNIHLGRWLANRKWGGGIESGEGSLFFAAWFHRCVFYLIPSQVFASKWRRRKLSFFCRQKSNNNAAFCLISFLRVMKVCADIFFLFNVLKCCARK